MRRIICGVIIIFTIISLCACSFVKKHNTVLEVNAEFYDDDQHHHSPDIKDEIISSVDDNKVGDRKTITFLGKQYDLVYKETMSYVLSDTVADIYDVENQVDQSDILLLQDGTIYAILSLPIGWVNIDKKAEVEVARTAVEDYLKDEIDFDSFEYFESFCSLPDTSNGFGMYSFLWYNKIGDIKTHNCISLCVHENGEINALKMHYRKGDDFSEVPQDIKIENYYDDIERKLKRIYGKDFTRFEVMNSTITRYNGSNCINCTVGVHYYRHKDFETSEAINLLVVID